jgi:hypothetical protein
LIRIGWLLLALGLSSAAAAQGDALGIVTILEGQALVVRGAGRVQAAEGVRLSAGDIVHTAPSTFAQIEMTDRTVMQLGPSTRLMFNVATTRGKTERSWYLLDGWLKLTTTKRDAAAGPGFDLRAPTFEIPAGAMVAVLHSTPAELRVFVESGEARLVERAAPERHKAAAPPAAVVALRANTFYQRKPPARGTVAPSVPAAFVETLPRAFRDAVPARAERFRDRNVAPREAAGFGYADVEDWLKAEPAIRRPLMQRWRARADDKAFRSALVANLSAHPEWDPILFPEKYRPKPPPPPRPPVASPPVASPPAAAEPVVRAASSP